MSIGVIVAAGAIVAGLTAVGAFLIASGPSEEVATIAETEPAEEPGNASANLSFRLADTGSHGSEVTIGVDGEGTIYLGGWDTVASSSDGGETWQHSVPGVLPDNEAGADAQFAADRVLTVDEDTGRVFVDDTTLGCTVLRWSDDGGQTWTSNPIACGGGATDHQKVALGPRTTLEDPTGELYPNIVYVCANGLTHTPCAASTDGGRTFGPGAPSQQLDAEDPTASQTTCAFQGMPTANEEGRLFQPQTQCGAKLWFSDDNGLTWTHTPVPVNVSEDTADVATGPGGSVFYTYTDDDWQPRIAVSEDAGESFADTIAIGSGNLTSSLFAVATAQTEDRVGFAYYATSDDPEGWNHNPGDAPDAVTWQLFAGVVTDVHSSDPDVHVGQLTSQADPIQRGCISKLGDCLGNIADYIDVGHGPEGKLHVGYVDGCDACGSADDSDADDAYVAVQTGGPRLS